MRKLILSLIVCIFFVNFAFAEVFYLKDGSTIKAQIISSDNDIYKVKTDYSDFNITKNNIEKIDFSNEIINVNQNNNVYSYNTNQQSEEEEKYNSFSIASHYVSVAFKEGYDDPADFTGVAFWYQRAVNKYVAVKGGVYFTSYDDTDIIEEHYGSTTYYSNQTLSVSNTGFEYMILFGNNFTKPGFKIYTGLGYFSESWSSSGYESSEFSGLEIPLGIGYNWRNVSLDLYTAYRNKATYQDEIGVDAVESAASGGLSFSFRF